MVASQNWWRGLATNVAGFTCAITLPLLAGGRSRSPRLADRGVAMCAVTNLRALLAVVLSARYPDDADAANGTPVVVLATVGFFCRAARRAVLLIRH